MVEEEKEDLVLKGKRVSFEGEQGALPLRKLPSVPILSQVWNFIVLKSTFKCHKSVLFFSQSFLVDH